MVKLSVGLRDWVVCHVVTGPTAVLLRVTEKMFALVVRSVPFR
jgi:hypothetical protein